MTNKAKHTPGPWTITEDGRIQAPKLDAKCWEQRQYKHIASAPFAADALTPIIMGGERAANARLIAAAPELLAALEWALKNIEELAIPEFDKRGAVTSLNNCADKARAAIAKAKGE